MESNKTIQISVKSESLLFYVRSGFIYITARNVVPYIENNKIVVNANEICRLKFSVNILGDTTFLKNIHHSSITQFDVNAKFEECHIFGAKRTQFIVLAIVNNEDNHGATNTQ